MKISLSLKVQGREYMSPSRGISAFRAQLQKSFEEGVEKVKPDMRVYLDEVVEALVEKHSKPWPGGTTPNSLSKRSGAGVQSIREGAKITGGRLDTLRARLQIPTPMAYHEAGYTKSAAGKLLTIPLPAALDGRGVPLRRSPRDWENTFVTTSKNGNLIIFQRKGRRIVPLYVLKDSVNVPPRLGARAAFQSGIPHFQERMADDFAKAFQ
jgi:hypothetical protein